MERSDCIAWWWRMVLTDGFYSLQIYINQLYFYCGDRVGSYAMERRE